MSVESTTLRLSARLPRKRGAQACADRRVWSEAVRTAGADQFADWRERLVTFLAQRDRILGECESAR
jgi:hypothetical protein